MTIKLFFLCITLFFLLSKKVLKTEPSVKSFLSFHQQKRFSTVKKDRTDMEGL